MGRKPQPKIAATASPSASVNPYLAHFGLMRSPFSTTPDPAMAFASREHKDAITKIAFYTAEKRGIFLVLGEIGTGKTTLAQLALSGWRQQPDNYFAAHITDPSPRTAAAFMRLVLASYGLPTPRNLLDLKATLRQFLIEQKQAGRTVVLLIDEAQSIYPTNLDTLQAMSNEQTQTEKLIQICLFAQPNFEFKLTQKPALRSRIAGGMTLNPVTPTDAIQLLRHRMGVAGGDFDTIFQPETHNAIYAATNGVPRDLCVLCDAAMVEALVKGSQIVTGEILEDALKGLSFKGWGIK